MRKRISSFNIKGLNTSMPDISVPDGACEVLENLRFQNGAWEPVGTFPPVKGGAFDIPVLHEDTITLLYAHEMDGDIHFIVKAAEEVDEGNNVFYNVNLYDCFNGTTTLIGTFATVNNPQSYEEVDIRVSSFGNVLIVSTKDTMLHYIFSDGTYTAFTIPSSPSIATTIAEDNVVDVEPDKMLENIDFALWYLLDAANNHIMRPINNGENNMWWGEICYLVAYRMKGGSTISPSKLQIACSEGANTKEYYIGKGKVGENIYFGAIRISDDIGTDHSMPLLRSFIPTIEIAIPSGIDMSIVDRVAIYSTRINSILDFEKMVSTEIYDIEGLTTTLNGVPAVEYSQLYADNNLPNQPFYLVEEKKIEEIYENGNVWRFDLGYDKLKDIVTNPTVYEAVQVHSFLSEAMYDYNHRIHFGGLTTSLYSHTPNVSALFPRQGFSLAGYNELVELNNGYGVLSSAITPEKPDEDYEIIFNTPIISYPDYRAHRLSVIGFYENGVHTFEPNFQFKLKPAAANNFAYHIFGGTRNKYAQTKSIIESGLGYSSALPLPSPTFSEPNRIQVSAVDNPFSLPFQNSYAVGNEGSRVVAMNSVADALADSTFFGTYPLYIFTTDGIFALRAGSGEVLYAGTENINHDRITNPTTIAVNGSVVYACSEGLKALSERTAVRISADIDSHNGVRRDWSTAQFAVNWRYGELICKLGDECFVWNIGARAWSTRTDVLGHLRNGFIGKVEDQTITMHDVNDEQLGEVRSCFVTRPLKFESSEFKKIERMIARVAASQSIDWDVVLEGSNNCNTWITIKKGDVNSSSNIALRHLGNSFRYYRLSIGFTSASLATISQIDVALQDRFYRNLI